MVLYEQSMIKSQPCYVVTSLPINIQSSDTDGTDAGVCTMDQNPFTDPQKQSQVLPEAPPFSQAQSAIATANVQFGDCPAPPGASRSTQTVFITPPASGTGEVITTVTRSDPVETTTSAGATLLSTMPMEAPSIMTTTVMVGFEGRMLAAKNFLWGC